jgi:hypothetical protein
MSGKDSWAGQKPELASVHTVAAYATAVGRMFGADCTAVDRTANGSAADVAAAAVLDDGTDVDHIVAAVHKFAAVSVVADVRTAVHAAVAADRTVLVHCYK